MTEKIKFNEWMQKIKNIHYADNKAMTKAYEKINENMNTTYLKKEEFATTVVKFDRKKLSKIDLFKSESCEIKIFDSLEELNDSLTYYMKNKFTITEKSVFDKKFIEYAKKLNELSNEK